MATGNGVDGCFIVRIDGGDGVPLLLAYSLSAYSAILLQSLKSCSSFAAILYVYKGVWPRSRLQSRAGKNVCKGGEYPLPLYVLSFVVKNVQVGANNVV